MFSHVTPVVTCGVPQGSVFGPLLVTLKCVVFVFETTLDTVEKDI